YFGHQIVQIPLHPHLNELAAFVEPVEDVKADFQFDVGWWRVEELAGEHAAHRRALGYQVTFCQQQVALDLEVHNRAGSLRDQVIQSGLGQFCPIACDLRQMANEIIGNNGIESFVVAVERDISAEL